jgi:putative ABC transport system substrate-binding protein
MTTVEIETAMTALGREPGCGLVVLTGGFMLVHRVPIILAAARNNVSAVYVGSEFVRNAGLFSYGVGLIDTFRRAATYVDRILRGAKPAELPVQLPTKFERPGSGGRRFRAKADRARRAYAAERLSQARKIGVWFI